MLMRIVSDNIMSCECEIPSIVQILRYVTYLTLCYATYHVMSAAIVGKTKATKQQLAVSLCGITGQEVICVLENIAPSLHHGHFKYHLF